MLALRVFLDNIKTKIILQTKVHDFLLVKKLFSLIKMVYIIYGIKLFENLGTKFTEFMTINVF
jgi:hypothetical protein